MKTIPLGNGFLAFVDDEDFDWLSRTKWRAHRGSRGKTYYAVTGDGQRYPFERMHRRILGLAKGDPREGHHKDGNGLNNQRSNLSIATHEENMACVPNWKRRIPAEEPFL